MRTTMQAIREHRDMVIKEYGEERVLGVFLYGSQNYGIATENSDVDTKAILVPTIRDLCLKNKPVSREMHLENGEHCEVKDIREIKNMFLKQNINFLEILYTDYCWINPKYMWLWKKYFIANSERICYYDIRYATMSICGQAIHTLKQKRDGKNYANGLRLYHTLENLSSRMYYGKAIDMSSYEDKGFVDRLIKYKSGELEIPGMSIDFLISLFEERLNQAKESTIAPDEEVVDLLNEAVLAIITNEQNDFDFYKE